MNKTSELCQSKDTIFLTNENCLPSALALYAAPTKAAPATCMMIVRVSATIKTMRIPFGVTKRGRSCADDSVLDEAALMESVSPR